MSLLRESTTPWLFLQRSLLRCQVRQVNNYNRSSLSIARLPRRTTCPAYKSIHTCAISPLSRVSHAVQQRRHKSSVNSPDSKLGVTAPTTPTAEAGEEPAQRPSYELVFTCKPCGDRSAHVVTKQAYHKGTILIRCPKCNAHHVLADHLKVNY